MPIKILPSFEIGFFITCQIASLTHGHGFLSKLNSNITDKICLAIHAIMQFPKLTSCLGCATYMICPLYCYFLVVIIILMVIIIQRCISDGLFCLFVSFPNSSGATCGQLLHLAHLLSIYSR